MASQKNFAITPSVSISRSKFRRPSQHKTAFNLGDIVPIYVDADILPGDTVSMDLATLVRMSNPQAPLMDNIFIDYYAFFCPNRLLWYEWKKFMGENTTSAGAVTTEPTFPVEEIGTGNRIINGCIGDYMGLPHLSSGSTSVKVSSLPGRAYTLVYSEWFRDQNLINPIVNIDQNAGYHLGTQSGTSISYNSSLFKAAKESDYFTRALPFAQKGAPVSLPLGSTAPIILNGLSSSLTADGEYALGVKPSSSQITAGSMNLSNAGDQRLLLLDPDSSPILQEKDSNFMWADLSAATSATINQLRFAFQYQKFLEKDALYGSRYWEILKGHFGITAPDASLQRPELLGHFRQHVNIDQVLQTTGWNSTPSSNSLGTPGANSVSGKSEHIISKSFVEHGVLLIVAVARHDQSYGQGVNRMWSRIHRTDFYFPVFANLGAQEIKNKEIYAGTSSDELPFGYQEAWAEYRYKPSICTNVMNAATSGSMSFWNLGNNFGSLPTLSQSFIEQDRTNISRALVTGSTGPDFIADFYFDAVYVRPMPMYSIPGLIDHH